jgi:multidrug efflux pump subunit AcrA (membrane-fusion protein)
MVGVRSQAAGTMDSLITLYDPEHLQVRAEVPIDKFQLVRPDQPATVEVDVLPGRRLAGVVLYDTHETDIQRNTVRVKVGLHQYPSRAFSWPYGLPGCGASQAACIALNTALGEFLAPLEMLRPGMIAKVRVLSPPTPQQESGGEILRIFIPRRLIIAEGGQSQVWIVDQAAGRAVLRAVVLGSGRHGDRVEIAQGLQPSDKLIVSGRETLRPGQRVRVTEESP